LTNAKVIVMDEATASVDVQTDALLQTVIRKSFAGVTMLIIAHRLGTIADCDKIVEISAGEIKSIRTPEEFTTQELEESLT
jgi:ABC-type multidrug transport system fused ATPase/permease subunit